MKFYSFHPGMKSTCKQKCFHPRTIFIPGEISSRLHVNAPLIEKQPCISMSFCSEFSKAQALPWSIVKDVSIAFRGFSKTLSKEVARQVDYSVFKPITQDNCDINSYLVEFGKLPKNHLIKVTWVCCKIWGIPQSPSDKF